MKNYSVNMKLSIVRQYEVQAENEQEAKDIAAGMSCSDMSDCDEYEVVEISER